MKQRNPKWIIALTVCLTLCVTLFAGCGTRDKVGGSSSSASSQPGSSSLPSSSSNPSSGSKPESSSAPSSSGLDESSSSAPLPERSEPDDASTSSAAERATAAGSADFSQIGALDGAAVTWGPGRNYDGENRPTACVGLQEQYGSYGCKFIGDKAQKTVYLTFDQGYENGYTEKILDTLREKKAPAVFFLTGHYVDTTPELIRRMVEEGHVLGNHSNHHYDATEVPLETMQQDLTELNGMVKDQFSYDCKLYRFPEGKFSEQTLALTQQNGMTPVFWSFAYADWDPQNQMAPADALQQLTERLHCGAIYLLHSVSATNAEVLGDFIDAARAQGYEFAALTA